MDDIIQIKDEFYIRATSPLADDRSRVLKQGETFAVFDRYGDIRPIGIGQQGLYHEGTRFLSFLELRLGREKPLLLSSTVKEDNALLTVDLTNPDICIDGEVAVPRGSLHIFRCKFLWDGVCYERFRISNYGLSPAFLSFNLTFDADFVDIFEVRGLRRPRRGRRLPGRVEDGCVILAYEGLDGRARQTRLESSPRPKKASPTEFHFEVALQPQETATIFVTVSCEVAGSIPHRLSYNAASRKLANSLRVGREMDCEILTSNEQFNDWLNRSRADLRMMVTETPEGPYPYAGVPWFSTAFGRDGLITALESLWVSPWIARGVLAYLAANQATEFDPEQDCEPGKILHETRSGEMASLGEIPFGRYYGSVDSTPLFVLLAGEYYERTADRPFIEAIWPNIEKALEWIDTYGDRDGDGFVEYERRSSKGLVHHGWRDSDEAIFHADGSLAEGPIALCEVQGYVYAAKKRAAQLASALGMPARAEELLKGAEALRERFEQTFWCQDLLSYAMALDGRKRLCRVRSSAAGHCLFTGIASREHARLVAQTLMDSDFFAGWGIRTVAASEARYNPMSYHSGSIWPHDNALIASGMARYGYKDSVVRIFSAIFDASLFFELHRLPELYCGFARRTGEGPTLYPVACEPQSWAAASVFFFLQACLGLAIDAVQGRVSFSHPVLPEFLQEVQLRNLQVGEASLDLSLQRHERDVGINVERKEGEVEIVIVK